MALVIQATIQNFHASRELRITETKKILNSHDMKKRLPISKEHQPVTVLKLLKNVPQILIF